MLLEMYSDAVLCVTPCYQHINLSSALTTVMEIFPTLFEYSLSDDIDSSKIISKENAEAIMLFFAESPIFNRANTHNGCEARADAICVLLEAWNIPVYKAWVFSGNYLKKHIGGLKKNWNFHVAPMLQVVENGNLIHYIIDPATSPCLQTLLSWAAGVTEYAHSYHFVKEADWYIFSDKKITQKNWNSRNRQNRRWMIQGLAGINGLSNIGKAALVFNKRSIKNTAVAFEKIKNAGVSVIGLHVL